MTDRATAPLSTLSPLVDASQSGPSSESESGSGASANPLAPTFGVINLADVIDSMWVQRMRAQPLFGAGVAFDLSHAEPLVTAAASLGGGSASRVATTAKLASLAEPTQRNTELPGILNTRGGWVTEIVVGAGSGKSLLALLAPGLPEVTPGGEVASIRATLPPSSAVLSTLASRHGERLFGQLRRAFAEHFIRRLGEYGRAVRSAATVSIDFDAWDFALHADLTETLAVMHRIVIEEMPSVERVRVRLHRDPEDNEARRLTLVVSTRGNVEAVLGAESRAVDRLIVETQPDHRAHFAFGYEFTSS